MNKKMRSVKRGLSKRGIKTRKVKGLKGRKVNSFKSGKKINLVGGFKKSLYEVNYKGENYLYEVGYDRAELKKDGYERGKVNEKEYNKLDPSKVAKIYIGPLFIPGSSIRHGDPRYDEARKSFRDSTMKKNNIPWDVVLDAMYELMDKSPEDKQIASDLKSLKKDIYAYYKVPLNRSGNESNNGSGYGSGYGSGSNGSNNENNNENN